jgi:hypothetical protein
MAMLGPVGAHPILLLSAKETVEHVYSSDTPTLVGLVWAAGGLYQWLADNSIGFEFEDTAFVS